MRVRTFSSDLMQTTGHLQRTIGQLEADKPPVVFIEKIMLMDPPPGDWYEQNTPGLMGLRRYLKAHYTPSVQGEYLVAMKRKEQ